MIINIGPYTYNIKFLDVTETELTSHTNYGLTNKHTHDITVSSGINTSLMLVTLLHELLHIIHDLKVPDGIISDDVEEIIVDQYAKGLAELFIRNAEVIDQVFDLSFDDYTPIDKDTSDLAVDEYIPSEMEYSTPVRKFILDTFKEEASDEE